MYFHPIPNRIKNLILIPMASIHSQLILTVLKLNLFPQLETPIAVDALAQKQNWNIANTQYMLNTLYSMGYIEKRNFSYQNTQETSRYLVKGKQEYIGGSILLFGNNTNFTNIDILTLLEKKLSQQKLKRTKFFYLFNNIQMISVKLKKAFDNKKFYQLSLHFRNIPLYIKYWILVVQQA